MGQEGGEKWTAADNLQPTHPKPDRLLAPADQPWGLREFVVQAPGGHRLVLGADAGLAPRTG